MFNQSERQQAVIVSQFGAFHGQNGAEAAHEAGLLGKFFTVRPCQGEIPSSKIQNLGWLDFPVRALNQANKRLFHSKRFDAFNFALRKQTRDWFDRVVSASISKKTKIFHAYSSFQERSLGVCEKLGVKRVEDWGIAHPQYLLDTMREEVKRLGLDFPDVNQSADVVNELERMDVVYVPSRFVKQTFMEHGYTKDNLRLNSYGVNADVFRPAVKRAEHNRRFVIMTAGMLGWRKGTVYLLEAARQLKKSGVKCDLYLMGYPDSDFQKKILARYPDLITHTGTVSSQQLIRYYQSADIFVLPSLIEGQARVVLEAMACGVPCIVTPNTGCEEIITEGKDGFIVPIRDSEAIAQRICMLHENRERLLEMGRQARKTAEMNSWKIYRERLRALYEEIMNV